MPPACEVRPLLLFIDLRSRAAYDYAFCGLAPRVIGQTISRYRIVEKLGGVGWVAAQSEIGHEAVNRFRQERHGDCP